MLIGILQLELKIGDALNAREKRRIVNALRDKWHHHHNVSVAEAEESLDHPQMALLGVVQVGNDARHLESTLAKMVEQVRKERRAELLDFRIEVISGRD
ncbi:MAG: DUF503 domain-containing protein [Phycisphaerae bacterium]